MRDELEDIRFELSGISGRVSTVKDVLKEILNELENIDYDILEGRDVLAEIRDELHVQNMIEAQRNEIMKENAFQSSGGSRILKVDTKLINKKLGEELLKL